MWNRADLKARAKERFKMNYWKCVLVGVIFTFLTGGFSGTATNNVGGQSVQSMGEDLPYDSTFPQFLLNLSEELSTTLGNLTSYDFPIITTVAIIAVVILVIILICALAIPIQVFLLNPLIVGCQRYFVKNLTEESQIKELGYCFDNKYLQNVKIMFFKDLYNFLWYLLFIIPGIVKSYEYRMIPFILADHTEITRNEAFDMSREMMNGNKWNAFVLDLSFIGWHLLNAFTFGILGIFYVKPFIFQTNAALYETLKGPEQTDETTIEMTM